MFVEKLTREQVEEFIREHLIEDFHPEVPKKKQLGVADYNGKDVRCVHYCSKSFNRHINVYLMDDRTEPLISEELEKDWIRHLYSIFGEEYKEWYLSEKEKMFN